MSKSVATLLLLAALAFTPLALAQSTPSSATGRSATAALHTRQLLWEKMRHDVERRAQEFHGVAGVTIRDLSDGREFSINGDDVFPTASCIKVALLTELYRQSETNSGAKLTDTYVVDAKDLAPDSYILGNLTPGVTKVTNRDLAGFVVTVSDNSATNILIDRVGMEKVNRMLDAAGLPQTRLRRKMMDGTAAKEGRENVSTPLEMAKLLEDIYRARIANRASSDDLLRLLSTYKDSWIPRLLPEELAIANKPGELDAVRNDVGIVLLKKHPYVITVFTTYAANGHEAEETISQISQIAYQYFSQVETASDFGRTLAQ